MIFDQIEQLKREYTDKLVIVEGARPELARFDGQTGRVKTINMNGRALVEFDANNNIGWYDIALDYLRVVDKPVEKRAKVESEAPAKTEKPAAKAAPASSKPPASPAGGTAKKSSTADILAAARANKAAAPAATAAPAEAPAPAKSTPPPAAEAPAPKAAKPAGKPAGDISVKSSNADKIAWCRQHDAQA